MTDLARFASRLAKQIDKGKGARLSAAELDLLVTSGAYETLATAAAAEMKRMAEARMKARDEQVFDPYSSLKPSSPSLGRAPRKRAPLIRP